MFWLLYMCVIGLCVECEQFVEWFDVCVWRMWEDGLFDEVFGFCWNGFECGVIVLWVIGYVQVFVQFDGVFLEVEVIVQMQVFMCCYVCCQVFWFKCYFEIEWWDVFVDVDVVFQS